MTKHGAHTAAFAVIFLCASATISASAQTFKTLVNFDGKNGAGPENMALVQGTDGSMYGATFAGGLVSLEFCGSLGCGTVFKITPTGALVTIHAFCSENNCPDGGGPGAGLVLATDGSFYGTTIHGGEFNGSGTVFRITAAGELKTLHTFSGSDGEIFDNALVQGADGNFYGTAMAGGANNYGTFFRITPTGMFTVLYNFCGELNCTDGGFPRTALIQATDGSFYGTASYGGAYSDGTVFRITKTGVLTTLHSFDFSDGSEPLGGLVQDIGGDLYGTTSYGGTGCPPPYGCGTVFRIDLGGTLTTLHNFDGTDGSGPTSGVFRGNDGNFYGTTGFGGAFTCKAQYGNTCGTVFEITPAGVLTSLRTFDFTDGSIPIDGLLEATDGTFYGTTYNGGLSGVSANCSQGYGCGTVFSMSTGLGPFVAFVRGAGKVGQTGGILGQGFIGTTNVSFNGIPANFTVISDTFIRATVPAGATTGYVTVITPSGTLTSNVPFQVIP